MKFVLLITLLVCTRGTTAFSFGNPFKALGNAVSSAGDAIKSGARMVASNAGKVVDTAGNLISTGFNTVVGFGGRVINTVIDPFNLWKPDSDIDHGHSTGSVVPCPAIADVVFVIDASSNSDAKNFTAELEFANRITEHFKIGPKHVQFGAVVFSTFAQKRFDLNTFTDHSSLSQAIKSIPHLTGDTRTDLGLDMVLDRGMLTAAHGARTKSSKIVIVITDGGSDKFFKTKAAANRLSEEGVEVIAVGIGITVPLELHVMASGFLGNVYRVSEFNKLFEIEQKVARKTCQIPTDAGFVPPPEKRKGLTCAAGFTVNPENKKECIDIDECISNPCDQVCTNHPGGYKCSCDDGFTVSDLNPLRCEEAKTCSGMVDVIFVIDSSGSIRPDNYRIQTEFAASLVQHFKVGPNSARVAALTFSDNVRRLFDLDTYTTADFIQRALRAAPFLQARTYINKALDFINQNSMFSPAHGGRNNAEKIVIVITDGDNSRPDLAQASASDLREDGVTIITLIVGSVLDNKELATIASSDEDVFFVDSYDLLSGIESRLADRTCAAVP